MSSNDHFAAATSGPNGHVADLADDFVHRLLDADRASDVERHCAACPACKAAVDDARRRLAVLHAEPAVEASEALVQKTVAKIGAHQKARKRRWRMFVGVAGGLLAASVVVLVWMHICYCNLTATPYDMVILGQRNLLAATDGSLRIVLRDHTSLAPLAGVHVNVQLTGAGKTADLASFTTDAHGGGEPRFTLPDWPDGDCQLRVVAQTAGTPETAVEKVALKRSFQVMLSSDKPVYQPGQTIHARALALRRPDLHPVADQTAIFSVVDPKGNIVFKQEGQTSKYGITASDCPLDAEIQEGAYTVLCKTGDVESRLAVDVKKYVLPKFKAAITTDKPFYKPGDAIKLRVQADYFFGKPAADAAVDVEATTDPAGAPMNHLNGRTDAHGAVTFDTIAPKTESARVRFQATVVDSAGQKQTASAERAVSTSPARIEVIPEAGELVQGVRNRVYVLVTRLDGTPVPAAHVVLTDNPVVPDRHDDADADENGAAVLEIVPNLKMTSFGPQTSLVVTATDDKGVEIARRDVVIPSDPSNDFLTRTDKAVYRGGETMTFTAVGGGSGPVFVDLIKDGQTMRSDTIEIVNGQGQAAIDLAPDLAGTLQVVAYRLDAKGYPVRQTRVVYVRPADEIHIDAALSPDKKEYKPGEKPMLHLKLTDKAGKPCPGAISLDGVDEAVFSVLARRPGMEQAFYTLEQDLMAPVERIHSWSPGDVGSQRYEEALFAAASRVDKANTSSPPPALLDEVRAVRLAPDVVSPPPLGMTHSLVAQTYQTKADETAAVRIERLHGMTWLWASFVAAVLAVVVLGFWLFGRPGALVKSLFTGYVALPFVMIGLVVVFGPRGIATDQVGFAIGMTPPVPAEQNGQKLRARHDGFVDEELGNDWGGPDVDEHGVDVMKDPAAGQPAATSPPRVRQLFPETLLWRPEIVTDDDGEATLPLDLADSITTWRLSASAVSADGKLGATQLPVKVFRDFFVDLNLPIALTRGDEVGVPVVVYNYLNKPQIVSLDLRQEDWFTLADGKGLKRGLEIPANDNRTIYYPLKVDKVGAWTLTVTAQGATDVEGDAIMRPIEVLPSGRRVEEVVNGTLEKPTDAALTLPADHVPGSEKAFVKIYPSTFSQVVEGVDGLFRMPYGCFEQTSSTTYPNVLALDYLKRTNKSAPDVEAKAHACIRAGAQRLFGFEVPGGGFEWFGNPPANRALTAYGLMEFRDMDRVETVDPGLIARTRSWLLAQRRPDGSWDPETHKMHDDAVGGRSADDARLAETAYIAWAVFGDSESANEAFVTLSYLKNRNPESIGDAHTLALVCNALLAVDEHNPDAGPYLDRLEAMKKFSADGKFKWWEQPAGARTTFYGAGRGGEVETTALATLALIRAGRNPDTTRKALAWLISQKDANGAWYSTQATVLALKALLAGTGKPLGGDAERVVEVRLDGGLIDTVRIPADQAEVMKQVDLSSRLKSGKHTLTISETHGAAIGFQATFRYNVDDAVPATDAAREKLAVDVTYDRKELAVAEQVQATATLVNKTGDAAPMVMVELPIPPGFVPSTDDFAALIKPGGKVAKYQIQPRSVLLYLTALDKDEKLTATYHLTAKTPATAQAAGPRVYEYYDPDVQGSGPGTRFTVKARK